jgi:hypothetical protein
MQSIKGTRWGPSDGESPAINGWLNFVGTTFPEMAGYCNGETHIGYFSWCGCTVGYCIAKAGSRPVYTKGLDTKSFLWAQAWLDWGTPVNDPQPGDVLVFDFGHGDHHVGPPTGAAAGATKPQLSPIDRILGGEAMVGLKTLLAIAGFALMWILQAFGVMGTATGYTETTTGTVLTILVSAFSALGVTAKFDRALQALSTIAALLQKLSALAPPVATPTGGK